ncbi:MAG TPA: MerR family transcriptional regulator, partial [Acidimicrobiales bacterium]
CLAVAVDQLTVDELAQRAKLPVRTIREYQTMGLLPGPTKRGRVGVYRRSHLARLQLIARLQDRGYSLAGVRDLLASWRDGADLGEVLGLVPDELVHVDEPGTPATLDQLTAALPALVPEHLGDLMAQRVIEECGPDRYCVPSPSLLQLARDTLNAGYGPDRVLELLAAISRAAADISTAVVAALGTPPETPDQAALARLATRGRGLLAHGTGRLTVHTLGRRLGITDDAAAPDMIRQLLGVDTSGP